jgi:hypothetical protein
MLGDSLSPLFMRTKIAILTIFLGLNLVALIAARAFETGDSVVAKSEDIKIYKSADEDSEEVGSVGDKKCKVEQVSGNWLKVQAGSMEGWVFAKNMQAASSATTQTQVASATDSSNPNVVFAGRGAISDLSLKYGDKQNKAETVSQLNWMLHFNNSISEADVRAYDQENHLGK